MIQLNPELKDIPRITQLESEFSDFDQVDEGCEPIKITKSMKVFS